MGDFNEWVTGLTTRVLREKFESLDMELHLRRKKAYPGLLPFLHLDHIYFERPCTFMTRGWPGTGSPWWLPITCP